MFDLLPPAGCLQVLEKKLLETGIAMPLMEGDENSYEQQTLERLLRNLAQTPSWGNARDVETLAKNIARKVFVDGLMAKGKKGKKVEEKKGEGKKKEVKAVPVARARGKEEEKVAVVEEKAEEKKAEEEKKVDEKKDEEKTVDEVKVEERKPALVCTLDVATTAMEEMLAERKARDGMGIYPGMYC